MSPRESLDVVAARVEAVRTLSAECDLTLTDPAGESVRLDGAIAAAFPDRLRMRAWKFGNAVFDITVAAGRTWILADDAPRTPQQPDAGVWAAVDRLPSAIGLLGAEYFRSARVTDDRRGLLTVTGPAFEGVDATCEIDRTTLTVRRLTFANDESASTRWVSFDRYHLIDAVVWPTRVRFSGPEGVIFLRFREVQLNGTLAESAFVPPRRAIEQP